MEVGVVFGCLFRSEDLNNRFAVCKDDRGKVVQRAVDVFDSGDTKPDSNKFSKEVRGVCGDVS